MPKIIIYFFFLLYSTLSYSQINHIKILIGATDTESTKYFDSLFSFKNNPYYEVKKGVSDDGDLMLYAEFAIVDEEFYNCLGVILRFRRDNGVEHCVVENISGDTQYAQSNLDYLKDNFTRISDSTWERLYIDPEIPAKIVATFKVLNGKYPEYDINYELVDK